MEIESLEKMAKRCWSTGAARFEASRRMQRCHIASTLCVAMLSLEIIVINLLVFIPSLHLDDRSVTVITVCLSAFVLVFSLIISQLKYDAKASEYHRCGVELANLEKQIRIYIASGRPETYDVMMGYNGRYAKIIRDSNLNHSTIDYDWAMIKDDKKNGKTPVSSYQSRKWIWTYVKWHLLLPDSIYNLITLLGLCAIVFVTVFCKTAG